MTSWIKQEAQFVNLMFHLIKNVCREAFDPHLLFGDADVAQVRFEGLVGLLGEHPVAAERLTKHGLQEEVRFLRVVHHHHKKRHGYDQAGGNKRLLLWRQRAH